MHTSNEERANNASKNLVYKYVYNTPYNKHCKYSTNTNSDGNRNKKNNICFYMERPSRKIGQRRLLCEDERRRPWSGLCASQNKSSLRTYPHETISV